MKTNGSKKLASNHTKYRDSIRELGRNFICAFDKLERKSVKISHLISIIETHRRMIIEGCYSGIYNDIEAVDESLHNLQRVHDELLETIE